MRNKKKEIYLPNSGIKNNINIKLQSRINVSFLLLMFLMIWVLLNNAVVLHTCAERDTKSRMWFYNLFNHLI